MFISGQNTTLVEFLFLNHLCMKYFVKCYYLLKPFKSNFALYLSVQKLALFFQEPGFKLIFQSANAQKHDWLVNIFCQRLLHNKINNYSISWHKVKDILLQKTILIAFNVCISQSPFGNLTSPVHLIINVPLLIFVFYICHCLTY